LERVRGSAPGRARLVGGASERFRHGPARARPGGARRRGGGSLPARHRARPALAGRGNARRARADGGRGPRGVRPPRSGAPAGPRARLVGPGHRLRRTAARGLAHVDDDGTPALPAPARDLRAARGPRAGPRRAWRGARRARGARRPARLL
jgi:hypothetical protein